MLILKYLKYFYMSYKERYTNVLIRKEVYGKLREKLEKMTHKMAVSAYIEDLVLENLETSDLMRLYGPFLSYLDHNENTIFISDWKTQRIASVRVQVKEDGSFSLFCDLDQSDSCAHVGFVFALPQFYRILKEKGIKPKTPS